MVDEGGYFTLKNSDLAGKGWEKVFTAHFPFRFHP